MTDSQREVFSSHLSLELAHDLAIRISQHNCLLPRSARDVWMGRTAWPQRPSCLAIRQGHVFLSARLVNATTDCREQFSHASTIDFSSQLHQGEPKFSRHLLEAFLPSWKNGARVSARSESISLAPRSEPALTLPSESPKHHDTLTMAIKAHATQFYTSPNFSNASCQISRPKNSSPSNAYRGYGNKSSLPAQNSKE